MKNLIILCLLTTVGSVSVAQVSINPQIGTASIVGVAPMPVFFDATATTINDSLTNTFHELYYQWNFGDFFSGFWTNIPKSKNRASHPLAAHVFDSIGLHIVELEVFKNASYSVQKPFIIKIQAANDFYKNEKRTYSSYQDWTPGNADEEYGGYLSMKSALAHSVNTVSVQVLFDAGVNNVVKTAEQLGVSEKLNAVPSLVLGTSDVSLMSMVKAYATLANRGMKKDLFAIERIEDKLGNVLFERADLKDASEYANIEQQHFDELNQMLNDVTKKGTGSRIYSMFEIPFSVKGKTGTTQNQSDGWFIGFTDDLVIGAWVGTEDRRIHFRNLGTGSGGRTALPMVGAMFEYAAIKNKVSSGITNYVEFECPDYLDDEQYAIYNSRYEEVAERRGDQYGGWLSEIFKPKKTAARRRNERKIREQIQRLQQQKEERLRQYEREQKIWERKLKELLNEEG